MHLGAFLSVGQYGQLDLGNVNRGVHISQCGFFFYFMFALAPVGCFYVKKVATGFAGFGDIVCE